MGRAVRCITNLNSRSYWNKKLLSRGESWRDFPYHYLAEFLPENEAFSLLDIGCALGEGCTFLKSRFPESRISGADFSDAAIAKAKAKFKDIDFFILDIKKQNPPGKYDYITMLSTLEHFNNPLTVVDKCLLFANKALLVEVPYAGNFRDPRLGIIVKCLR